MWFLKIGTQQLGLLGQVSLFFSSTPLNLLPLQFNWSAFFQFSMTAQNTVQTWNLNNVKPTIVACSHSDANQKLDPQIEELKDEELRILLVPKLEDLPFTPPSAVESNFVTYFAPDFMKPGHDQYVHRHANGLCIIGLASTHIAFKDEGGVTLVDFNVGKSDRSGHKVTGKRKKNAQHFESNTALCKARTNDTSYIVRCCVKGSLLEVNDRLIKQPELLNSSADREGYIAIIMPKPADWVKAKATLLGIEEYRELRKDMLLQAL
ncbi:hypothetical protein RND71_027365 [Anisodus tanguticus]|uniref:Protein Abitram n=1 Tax=Anisodus tanguticus TaxID=243964 RepID=A0AAE1V1P0_9SOLA|nr:hypothetical protein RND71_027365 [Anisodus tanguticus]